MPLILAIEPDRRQAAQLSVVVRKRVHAELILVDTTERALDAIGNRMPDLVLVPALLSPQDDAAIAAALRVIAAAAHVQLLTIPVLGSPRPAAVAGGVLSGLLRGKPHAAEPDKCDPAVFAEQVASYLERAALERPDTAVELQPAYPLPTTAAMRPRPDPTPTPDPTARAGETIGAAGHAPVTIDDAFSQEWLQSVADQAAEPEVASPPDEGVGFALEEAVRALFADPAPQAGAEAAAIDPPPAVARWAEPPSERPIVHPAADAACLAVDDLIAALHLMPIAAIDVTSLDDSIAPAVGRQAVAEAAEIDDVKGSVAKGGGEWVALIESLRHDVERLRVERSEKPARTPAASRAPRPERKAKPIQDEWGFFDPQQCGFAALLAKLDEVTESEDGSVNH